MDNEVKYNLVKDQLYKLLVSKYGDKSNNIIDYLENNTEINSITSLDMNGDNKITVGFTAPIGISDATYQISILKDQTDNVVIEENCKSLADGKLTVFFSAKTLDENGVEMDYKSYYDNLAVDRESTIKDINLSDYDPQLLKTNLGYTTPKIFNNACFQHLERDPQKPMTAILYQASDITQYTLPEINSAIIHCWDERNPKILASDFGGSYYVYKMFNSELGEFIVPEDLNKTIEDVENEIDNNYNLFIEDIKENHPDLVNSFIKKESAMHV